MSTRKKPAVKRKKSPTKKGAVRKKIAMRAKKTAPKKPAPRRAAPRKKAATRPVTRPRPAPGPKPAPTTAPVVSVPTPAPAANEERIGIVTHYYGHLSVAAVTLESGTLRVGDTVRIFGHTSNYRQRVDSIQIEHRSVIEAHAGDEIGLRVAEHAREHDIVYKIA